ncbi:MAG: PHP domain-containing protein, partial [Betaproteobacteria bacterium]|nr:PHP domain-containing protein [Betaproteobacteria bacterium]
MLTAYAELHCLSNFSFLRGASHPEELVERAHALGYAALAITDEASLAGVVRAHQAAKRVGLPLLIGAEFEIGAEFGLPPGEHRARIILLAQTRAGYGHLSELISRTRRRAPKGQYQFERADLDAGLPDCIALLAPHPSIPRADLVQLTGWLAQRFGRGSSTADGGRLWILAERLAHGHDGAHLDRLRAIARTTGVPLAAGGDVRIHRRSRKPLLDVLTSVRHRIPLDALGFRLDANAECHLRGRLRLAQQYPTELLEETLEIAARCRFSLDELRYEYPDEIVPAGHTPAQWLRTITERGATQRWPQGIPTKVRAQIEHELGLIAELNYEPYFLTVAELV